MTNRHRSKSIALTSELNVIENALRCLAIVTDEMATEHLGTEEAERQAPASVNAVLVLIMERLRLLQRAMRGDLDPAVLWHRGNDVPPADTDDRGPSLDGWRLPKLLEKAKAEVRGLRAQLDRQKEQNEEIEDDEDVMDGE